MRALLPLACLAIVCGAEPEADKVPISATSVAVIPQSVNLSYNIQFNDQGQAKRTNSDLQIQLVLKPGGNQQLLASRGIKITEAVTDTGESLRPRNRGNENSSTTFGEYQRTNNSYNLSLSLTSPARPPQSIARVVGTITLAVISGEGQQSDIKPLKDFLGKPLLIEGLDTPITITRDEGRLTVRGSQSAIERMEKVCGLRADGREITFNGWGGGSDGDDYYRSYSTPVPDDGGVQIRLLPASIDIVVPFTLGPMTLFSNTASATTPGVVRIPANQPKAPETAKPKVVEPAKPGAGAGGF